jgi:hypothetical protein
MEGGRRSGPWRRRGLPVILAKHALEATLSADSAWKLWTDVPSWPRWDPTLERAAIDGAFRNGARLELRSKGGVRRPTLRLVEDGRGFSLEQVVLGTRITWIHSLEPAPLGVRIAQRVEVRGWAAWLVAPFLGPGLRAALPTTLRGLARQALEETRA